MSVFKCPSNNNKRVTTFSSGGDEPILHVLDAVGAEYLRYDAQEPRLLVALVLEEDNFAADRAVGRGDLAEERRRCGRALVAASRSHRGCRRSGRAGRGRTSRFDSHALVEATEWLRAAGLARIRARLVVRLMAALVAAVTRSRLNSLAFHLVFAHHSHLVAEYLELVAPSTCLVVYTRTK